jgi:hypothetical protein
MSLVIGEIHILDWDVLNGKYKNNSYVAWLTPAYPLTLSWEWSGRSSRDHLAGMLPHILA